MGGKPVFEIDSKTVIDFTSDFGHKKLCDGLTFSLGSVCVYSCAFCYVIPMILKQAAIQAIKRSAALLGKRLEDVVIRRRNAIKILRRQLTIDKPAHVNLQKKAVIYTSPLVDAAANMVLVKETAVACRIILELTNWDVRVLSKSNLLPKLANLIPEEFKHRMIYGFSTGTFDDDLCKSFEKGTALVSKRIEALHWLQDNGYRTFGMLCPILPQDDYEEYAKRAVEAIRLDRCEHVWVEVINLRGNSFTATCKALKKGGFHTEAERLREVCGSGSGEAWEQYARDAFEGLARHVPPEKLRFLQYAKIAHAKWWIEREPKGAILLGSAFE
jgi:DNA repair photolyase